MRYTKKEDAEHLVKTIQGRYPIKTDWEPTFYLEVTLEFNYEDRTCKMSMPGYVKQALIKLQDEFKKTTNSPSPFMPPVYGQKIQMASIDKTSPMTKQQTTILQQVCETFLYYARAVDCTMLHALNNLATRVKDGTQKTGLSSFQFCETAVKAHADT